VGVRVRRPFGARGMGSVGMELGSVTLKINTNTHSCGRRRSLELQNRVGSNTSSKVSFENILLPPKKTYKPTQRTAARS
jgi:hypothetical protein